MRKTQKNVMVALHVLDLERECTGVSWFFFALLNSHMIIVRYCTVCVRTYARVNYIVIPGARLVFLPPRGEGLKVDGELAVPIVVGGRADLALDFLHRHRQVQRLDAQPQFLHVERAGAVLVSRLECLTHLLRIA